MSAPEPPGQSPRATIPVPVLGELKRTGTSTGPRRALPLRYEVKETSEGRVVTCFEAPTIEVLIRRGMTATAAAARQAPAGSIFLDGAAQGEPFLDAESHIYNLDHHDGCVRSFTLAACEQALILVCKGLDLRAREWRVFANAPDLDTILAIWVLLNHMRLSPEATPLRRRVIPLLRVEGCIDVHGLEMRELCGYSQSKWDDNVAKLQQLGQLGEAIFRANEGQEVDPADYTAQLLQAVDSLVYSGDDFEEVEKVEELGRSELPGGGFAVACRAEGEIFEVEQGLRRLYGGRLGLIVLEKKPGTYTLRQADSFLPGNLAEIYRLLNLVDPAAGNTRSGNRWGGSETPLFLSLSL